VAACRQAGDRETELEGWRLQFIDLLEAGEMDRATWAGEQAARIIEELRRPIHLWYPPMWAAMDALRRGEPDAPELVEAFHRDAGRWGYRDVRMVHGVQRVQLALDTGTARDALPLARSLRAEFPDRFAPVLAATAAAAGELDEAAEMIEVHAPDRFGGLPSDLSWLYSVALYASAANLVGDPDSSTVLAGLLEPWADHFVVLGSGALCIGAAQGFLAAALAGAGELDRAAHVARDAVLRNERAGCIPAARWTSRLLHGIGREGEQS
jgi:hypothetical protein